jgi:hypothetical protein
MGPGRTFYSVLSLTFPKMGSWVLAREAHRAEHAAAVINKKTQSRE